MEAQEEGLFKKHWKIIVVAFSCLILIALFIIFSGKTSVSPDLVYFPT